MFRLRIEGRALVRPAMPTTAQAGVNVWRDVDSRPIAWAQSAGEVHWMHWPGLASFRFTGGSDEIIAFPDDGAPLELVRDTWRRTIVPMALQALGREALHASAVRGPRGVVAFCAQSQTGKSTLAFGLARRGYPQWADDAVVLDGNSVLPLPFAVHLRAASADHFDNHEESSVIVPDSEAAPLAAIFEFNRRGAAGGNGAIHVERLAGSASFVALLTHAYCFNPSDAERHGAMMRHYLDLAATVPVFRLAMPDDLAQLPRVLDEVERAMAGDEDSGSGQ